MELVNVIDFANRIILNKEYKILKNICGDNKIGRKSLKSILGFKSHLHRYFTNKQDGHKGFYIGIPLDTPQQDFKKVQELIPAIVEEVNVLYAQYKVNAYASCWICHNESLPIFNQIVGIKVDCNNWKSVEWTPEEK